MPPHGGHGGHGHGGHHGGGGRGGGWFGPIYGGGWDYGYPSTEVFVVDNNAPDDHQASMLAYVMSLPKSQRAAAYAKLFGRPAPASVLADYVGVGDTPSLSSPLVLLGIGAIVWLVFLRKKR